jgi:predicted DNA-binding transcriptional regulator YafY
MIQDYRVSMRASRLVGLLGLLQARGRMTASQLAGELEVSQRTILRDIEALNLAGFPIYTVRGSRGGFELLAGFTSALPASSPAHSPVRPAADQEQRALLSAFLRMAGASRH